MALADVVFDIVDVLVVVAAIGLLTLAHFRLLVSP